MAAPGIPNTTSTPSSRSTWIAASIAVILGIAHSPSPVGSGVHGFPFRPGFTQRATRFACFSRPFSGKILTESWRPGSPCDAMRRGKGVTMVSGTVPTRRLGRTGEEVSVIGLGGFHLGMEKLTESQASELVRTAIEQGVTFLDNSWGYHRGRSEERMGRALAGGWRERAFLMTKFDARDKRGALRQLDESLRRLQTDHLDLWQIHEVVYYNDPDLLSAPGGALEALDEARQAGKTRFLGFTGHKDPELHLETLDLFDFDAMQLPLNVMDHHFRSFEREVLPVLLERDLGVIGMKSFGDRVILDSGVAVSYTHLRAH